ncbi:pyridine nucleotide-disulfide oxidoreductase [Rhizobium leguminosarum bv. trifolii CB782]|uniref:Soluble pyridine nucleotide transhydrogenase n=1 Tax=Rhizobium hidalgonense TaxID=1538159 RepID=A0A2A6KBZ0_9HYPH|nr:Si-specific NAD(P)(+) transhydrogenase [Rhizobium hidalgonense]AHG45190.1 pyridine nucleotide-disulfide oxidoreductase [Rhizobium leguminosarum bv. trifolii CB782]EJC72861.1 pyruvate/2-oxoglutarate dehydrogenase complex, dihydrolipoamide dehydrogenase component [Rhizobium leguminosarum bv. trifolii WSM2012]MDR9774503.1 Si-specific NAD(P)(+) transhydrogenase [Rhizobium hidalgonense]MDR9805245.1 Si-specific NAD(P)(+) transhydrogenase [Rhizobium hidalgonense]MDR9809510.1 Si-specific NAD(P)(+) 
MLQYDLVVVGSGPAGRRGAIQAAKLGKKVLVIEQGKRVGGVSVHTGTIPSKTLRETALNLSGWRERGFYGRSYRVKEEISADDLRRRLLITLNHEVEVLEHQFARNRVQHIRGKASFIDASTLQVIKDDGEITQVTGASVLLAVGTKPFRPDYIPFDGKTVLDSDELLDIQELPRSMVVIGAGVIGIEYATIFSALDTAVTVIDPKTTMLDFIDKEIVEDFTYQLRDRNMKLLLGQKADKVETLDGGKVELTLDSGRRLTTDMVLFAAGRMGATDALNLPAIGLEADSRGRLKVNPETFQTSVANVYAAGDVVGFPSLASTSMEQGRIAARVAIGAVAKEPPKYFPYGIYAVPEISTCGLTEEEMKERGIPYECGIARFRETSRGHIMGLDTGLLKLIFSLKTRRLLGVHIVGEGATELVHIGQAVLNLKGTVEYFVENTFNYPTLAEAYKIAGLDAWNRMGDIKSEL